MYNNSISIVNNNWSVNLPLEDWAGVSVDEQGNVVALNILDERVTLDENTESLVYLHSLVYEGTEPDNNDITLVSLENLRIENGSLTFIPNWIINTGSLKALLYNDSLIESIPFSISRLSLIHI